MIPLTTGENHKSLSHTYFEFADFFPWNDISIVECIFTYILTCPIFIKKIT
jgi:hypothetical protein